jgi:hypothetical protein
MRPAGNGVWIEKFALPPGEYQYLLVVNGKEMCDRRTLTGSIITWAVSIIAEVGHYKQEELL